MARYASAGKSLEDRALKTYTSLDFEAVDGANLRILDFGVRPSLLAPLLLSSGKVASVPFGPPTGDFVISYVVCWPLMAACSVQVRHDASPFKPEYIIPQLILQCLLESDKIDGIRFFSVMYDSFNTSIPGFANYVFPSKDFAASGYCNHLRSKFHFSEPVPWALIRSAYVDQDVSPYMHFDFDLNRALHVGYTATEFGHVQAKLNHLPTAPLSI